MVKKSFVAGILASALAGSFAVTASAQERAAVAPLETPGMENPPITDRVARWNPDQYTALHSAYKAYEMCGGDLTEPAVRAIVSRIEALAGEPTSPAYKLSVQDEAQGAMESLVIVEGCADDQVQSALALFQQQLAPALGGNIAAMPAQ